ncbi:23S rRNA pseudouridine(1911/1915/1917) synthase RluD [Candidatus Schneideria nysicola]|uniref:23S rRNA pseudouridine(1911/1915/1917) synthase RluD n=1 Tax=Candidatus Schneideria nysicola TaxID=1081631 RepID=UPI001CAA4296|nr:23S rRNA pseudouridine(1911/1915/1917) synthase RluD [Candidatus Schneideria nysicola]UAJ65392.1 23S rRNA pseudouridine(1911/1915/1917) synthase RluD [Candidatus Schneideria nysicola]
MINISNNRKRLDLVVTELFPKYSRSQIKNWILQGRVKVNGITTFIPKKKVLGNESIIISFPLIKEEKKDLAQNIKLNILYEDDYLIIINKTANLLVCPGIKQTEGTIFNSLLYHYPSNILLPRAGIVHRLDKDTTGLMIIAKTILSQNRLIELIKYRKIIREYEAIVIGNIKESYGKIDKPIARHFSKRIHMIISSRGKPSTTHYKVIERFHNYTRISLRLESGRTHQIRVHMKSIGYPLVGDTLYGGNSHEKFRVYQNLLNRQALHAIMLEFYHPITFTKIYCRIPLPDDMKNFLDMLKNNHINYC